LPAPGAKPAAGKKPLDPPVEPTPVDAHHAAARALAKASDALLAVFEPPPPPAAEPPKPAGGKPAPAKPAAPVPVAAAPAVPKGPPLALATDGAQPLEAVFAAVAAILPPPPATAEPPTPSESGDSQLAMPSPVTMALVGRPAARPARAPPALTRIVELLSEEEIAALEESARQQAAAAAAAAAPPPVKAGAKATAAPVAAPPPPPPVPKERPASRWVIAPHSQMVLKVRFAAKEIGQYSESLLFELVANRKQFVVQSRATCAYPTVSADYRNVFMRKIKARPAKGTVRKQFVVSQNVFDFGPLLVGKDRSQYKNTPHEDNFERFRITNNGLFPVHLSFAMETDAAGAVFLLDPPELDLGRDETADLRVWAYPDKAGDFSDAVIVCMRDNPTPIQFPVACVGAVPVVQLDRTDIAFDKLRLGKTDTRTVSLTNTCPLPVAWQITGDELGDALTMSPTAGTLQPGAVTEVSVELRATATQQIKKALRLEVRDVEGLKPTPAQTTPITLTAEVYDIKVDLNFSRGDVAGLDFGTVRVFEQASQTITLKNRGLYNVTFKMQLTKKRYEDLFTITPSSGVLAPTDKTPTTVTINFCARRQVLLRDVKDLQCELADTNSGEVIMSLPIKVDVKALFSEYKVLPLHGINFGPVEHGSTSMPLSLSLLLSSLMLLSICEAVADWRCSQARV
jgi:hydrocephalus-inducing protein